MSFVESLLFYAGNSSQKGFLHATVSLNEMTVLNMTGTAKLCHVAGTSQQIWAYPGTRAPDETSLWEGTQKKPRLGDGSTLRAHGFQPLLTPEPPLSFSGLSQPCTCTYPHTQTQKYTHPQIKIKQQNLLRRIKIKQRLWNLTLSCTPGKKGCVFSSEFS